MPLLRQRSQVGVEIEAVEGTAETLVDADVFLAFDPSFEPSIEAHERDPARASLSPMPSVFGKRSGRIKFAAELVGTSAAGAANMLSDALQACGMGETLVAITSATYAPASSAIPSVTVGRFVDGKRHQILGARGTLSLLLEVGNPGIFKFDFLGADFTEADAALLTPTYNAVLPPTFQGATLTIDGYAATVSRVEIDFGNQLSLRPDANAASGHKSVIITNRKPTIKFDPEDVLVAAEDFLGNWRSGAQMAFSAVLGSVAGNVITITAPKVQYQSIGETTRDGLAAWDITGLLCMNAGDDEWSIAIT
ncbi:MAG: phage tail tube protein [Desulfobacterales bacterium]|nr:phage tail tube protein [Desulfobacterales bacterium]